MTPSSERYWVRLVVASLTLLTTGAVLVACASKGTVSGTSGIGNVKVTGTPSTAPSPTATTNTTPTPRQNGNPTVTITTMNSVGSPVVTITTTAQPGGGMTLKTGILLRTDYSITAQGPCYWYSNQEGLFIGATFKIAHVGLLNAVPVKFNLTNNRDNYGAYGQQSVGTFTSALGGYVAENTYPGTTIKLIGTINSDHAVGDTNPANDSATITIVIPPTPIPTATTGISC